MPVPVVPFVPDRFQSAVAFYVAHRLRWPRALIDEVVDRTGLSAPGRVLDLGCGPGFLAIAFAGRAGEVVGMDPDPAMLDAAETEAAGLARPPRFIVGSSYDLAPELGRFALVTMGRSFHWMDREATLRALDGMVEPQGTVALFNDSHEKCRANQWRDILEEVQKQFVDASASQKVRRDPEWDSHSTVLLDSTFSRVERHSLIERRDLTVDEIIGRALSMSAMAPQVLGDRLDEFQKTLRGRLLEAQPSGDFQEIVEFSTVLARRPSR
jgi:ubiquinone/menaquinone biosynthesis C-methylase UbiE